MTGEQFAPILVIDIDVASALTTIHATSSPDGQRYAAARCLVRLAGDPIGFVVVDLADGDVGPAQLAASIWAALSTDVREHARLLGGSAPDRLGAEGIRIDVRTGVDEHCGPLDATVVVATRDRPASLERCLRSILAMDRLPAEVIVVDNAPSDDAARAVVDGLAADAAVSIRYVREDRSGLAIAHNAALAHVRTTVVAFTDDDVIVDSLWLGRLAGAFSAAEGIACVTGMIVPAELATREQLWIEQYAGFNKGFKRKLFDLADHRPNDPLFPLTAGSLGSGANMAFTMSFLRQLGGFDVALGAGSGAFGGDDLAAFHDAIAGGWRLVYEPSAIVRHHHHRSYDSLRRQVYGYGAGLTAYLTHCVVSHPRRLPTLARRSVAGALHILSPSSSKNTARPDDYPTALVWAERRGMLVGPLAYVRARWKRRAASWALPVLAEGSPS
jgi:O-antigen biosynthesis protein